MYLTYDEYKAKGGQHDSALFSRLEHKARKKIDFYTQNRITETSEDIKACMFELIQLLGQCGMDEPAVTAESNAGMSMSYKVLEEKEVEQRAQRLIREYLPKKLLYLGGL